MERHRADQHRLVPTLPVTSGPNHDGGIILFGPPTVAAAQQKLFVVIGDLNRDNQLENFAAGAAPDDTACILRVNPDFTTPTGAEKGPFFDVAGGNASLERLYAYGVRNSFGMDFDPATGALWNTENGAAAYDEINRVDSAFNSGWQRVMGPLSRGNFEGAPGLIQFSGVGTYSDPEFSCSTPLHPRASTSCAVRDWERHTTATASSATRTTAACTSSR